LHIDAERRTIRDLERKLEEVGKIGKGKEETKEEERRCKSDRVRVDRRSGRVVTETEEQVGHHRDETYITQGKVR
jgi:hypothetical protein